MQKPRLVIQLDAIHCGIFETLRVTPRLMIFRALEHMAFLSKAGSKNALRRHLALIDNQQLKCAMRSGSIRISFRCYGLPTNADTLSRAR
jgi:hypothetical protein